MASSIGAGRTRAVLWIVAALAVVILALDLGSVSLTRMLLDDDAKEAARHAAKTVARMPVNPETAVVAYNAAVEVTREADRVEILKNPPGDAEDFRVGADGSITLTLEKEAPTLVWRYLPRLREAVTVHRTYHQDPIGY